MRVLLVVMGPFCLSRFIGNEVKAALCSRSLGHALGRIFFVDFLQASIHVCVSLIVRSLLGGRRLLLGASKVLIFEYMSYRFLDWVR